MRCRRMWTAVVVSLMLVFAVPAHAQDRALTPTLLKRIAEAIDGHRVRGDQFVVASWDSLNPVAGVFPSRDDAAALVRQLGNRWNVFGPYVFPCPTPIPGGPDPCDPDPIPEPCPHVNPSMLWPPGPRPGRGGGPIPIMIPMTGAPMCPIPGRPPLPPRRDLTEVILTYRFRDGSTHPFALPINTDAVFLTLPAMDKFVFPYYSRIIGLDSTSAWRQRIVSGLRGR